MRCKMPGKGNGLVYSFKETWYNRNANNIFSKNVCLCLDIVIYFFFIIGSDLLVILDCLKLNNNYLLVKKY